MCDEHHSYYLSNTLALAEIGRESVSPNPMVGAIVVQGGTVVGSGYHRAYGGAHAEAVALDRAGSAARGSTLYCNLEPCSYTAPDKHQPPCTRRIVAAGVERVVIGQLDPNPRVRGDGVTQLRDAGIEVVIARRSDQFWCFNDAFNTWMALRRPFVHLLAALQSDGSVDAVGQTALPAAAPPLPAYLHRLRSGRDAVAFGAEAIPELECVSVTAATGGNERTVVFDRDLRIAVDSELVRAHGDRLVVVGESSATSIGRQRRLGAHGATVCALPQSNDPAAWYRDAFEALAHLGITSLVVAAGERLLTELIESALFDRISVFGDDATIERIEHVLAITAARSERVGDRYCLDGYHRSWLPRVQQSVGCGVQLVGQGAY